MCLSVDATARMLCPQHPCSQVELSIFGLLPMLEQLSRLSVRFALGLHVVCLHVSDCIAPPVRAMDATSSPTRWEVSLH